ncbi:unnamed protein product [Protopolystoma xenopodis]|uniref:Uncharacterized protein n=1 Tax=Protopolystoma xenopodis TaxID=117903 RepID=A0A448WU77_9PLAT|nr:unnamed protein product [Protopolystoma xenopodis]
MSTMEQRLTETIAHYNVASHVKPPPPPSAPPPQLPPTTLAKVVAKPEDGTINRGVRCTPPLGRTGSSKRSIGHLTKVGGFMPPGASRQTEASYRHFVAPVEKKRRLWLFGVTSKSTELSDFRPVGPCGRTGQMEETGSSWSLGRSGPEGSHRQTKFICRTISQPIPTYQCMAGKSISPGGMQESPTYGVGYSCGEYAFRPDRGLFVGVPQIVVRALSPPTP